MKKLFLTSIGLSALAQFLGKPTKGLKLIYVSTAANPYKDRWWLDLDRDVLKKLDFNFIELDIADKTKKELKEIFKDPDVIFIAGGNTFYLLEKVQISGFDKIVKELVNKGVVYVGSSAGASLSAPDISPIALVDDPKEAPNLKSTKSLGLVDFLVVPHFDGEKFKKGNQEIFRKYKDKLKLIPLDNDQAVLVEGDKIKIVKSE